MRPVNKGSSSKKFSHYQDAADDLKEQLGSYCCYCERQIETCLAVEHVIPKSLDPDLETVWENFLLGCGNCNSCKGDFPVVLDDYLWPDKDNTLIAITYDDSLVIPTPKIDPGIQAKAAALIKLTGLDKDPGQSQVDRKPTKMDKRWLFRKDCWDLAIRSRDRLNKSDTASMREQIIETATSRGGYGIWFTIFQNDSDMINRFNVAFPNTEIKCFDSNARLKNRPGGKI